MVERGPATEEVSFGRIDAAVRWILFGTVVVALAILAAGRVLEAVTPPVAGLPTHARGHRTWPPRTVRAPRAR